MLETLKIIAAVLGVVAFAWRIRDSIASYLHIDIAVCVSENAVLATSVVENKGIRTKNIDNAFLLVGPEGECPIQTFNLISAEANVGIHVESTNDIAAFRATQRIDGLEGRQIIPLSFFYSENIRIVDERLTYSAPIFTGNIVAGRPYSVRLYVWDSARLHRSNQDCFVLSETTPD